MKKSSQVLCSNFCRFLCFFTNDVIWKKNSIIGASTSTFSQLRTWVLISYLFGTLFLNCSKQVLSFKKLLYFIYLFCTKNHQIKGKWPFRKCFFFVFLFIKYKNLMCQKKVKNWWILKRYLIGRIENMFDVLTQIKKFMYSMERMEVVYQQLVRLTGQSPGNIAVNKK